MSSDNLSCSLFSKRLASDHSFLGNNLISIAGDDETSNEDLWPTNDQDIVRYLIDKQKFDGSWDLDADTIEQLTGKPLTTFSSSVDNRTLISVIVIATLETRFTSHASMWHGIVKKAREYLCNLLGYNTKKLNSVIADLSMQLSPDAWVFLQVGILIKYIFFLYDIQEQQS